MKNKEQAMAAYEAPKVEVIEVEVEKGFATSVNLIGGATGEEDMGGGGSIGVPW